MNLSSQPEKPLIASLNVGGQGSNEEAGETFFFEFPNGRIIEVKERQAWQIYAGRQREKPKYIGCGDGRYFMQGIREAREIFEKEGLKASQERIRKGRLEEIEHARTNLKPIRNFDKMDVYGNKTDLIK